jgi:uncharacterized membrane protein YphA (DoxX/SURF4 family)
MQRLFLAGRIIVGGFFLFGAFNHFTNLGTMAAHAAARHVPVPGVAVALAGCLLFIAGLSFLLGALPRLGVAASVLFLVPVTLMMHAFWADTNPGARMIDMVNFTKNLALLGSSLMFLAVPEPWPYSVRVPVPRLRSAGATS